MTDLDRTIAKVARPQLGFSTRRLILASGGSDAEIQRRTADERLRRIYAGVYFPGARELQWTDKLLAVTLAANKAPVGVSHRAGAGYWDLDGFHPGPLIEATVPHGTELVAPGAHIYRSRIFGEEDLTILDGIPVTTVERTLIDISRFVGDRIVRKAMESALRRRLTTTDKLGEYATERGRNLRGSKRLLRVLTTRIDGGAADSGAEADLGAIALAGGLPMPERHVIVRIGEDTVYAIDLGWPRYRVGSEWDGRDYHSGDEARIADLQRRNDLADTGWNMRFFGGDMARHPDRIVATLRTALRQAGWPG